MARICHGCDKPIRFSPRYQYEGNWYDEDCIFIATLPPEELALIDTRYPEYCAPTDAERAIYYAELEDEAKHPERYDGSYDDQSFDPMD